MEERKYRSVGSDAERESQDGNRGKAGILAPLPQSEAKILTYWGDHRVHVMSLFQNRADQGAGIVSELA